MPELSEINLNLLCVGDASLDGSEVVRHLAQKEGIKVGDLVKINPDKYWTRAIAANWIASHNTHLNIIIGEPDTIIPALTPLLDHIDADFNHKLAQDCQPLLGPHPEVRAMAGDANRSFVYCLPASPLVCELAWQQLILPLFAAREEQKENWAEI